MSDRVGFVLDMSGSMHVVEEATREGTAGYIRELRRSAPGVRFSLTAFDTAREHWLVDVPVEDIDVEETVARYHPRGSTALYDAVGGMIERLKKASGEGERVTVVVMTDGHENASVKHDRRSVEKLVKKLVKSGTWTFVYLGANVDAWAEASKMGIGAGNTMAYSSSPGSTRTALIDTARATGMRVNSSKRATQSFYGDAGVEQDARDEGDKSDSA